MKYAFVILAFFCLATTDAFSQILNGEFEDWDQNGPINWSAPNSYWIQGQPHNGNYSFGYRSLPIMQSLILSGKFKISPTSGFLSFWYTANYPSESPLYFFYKNASKESTLRLAISQSWTRIQVDIGSQFNTDDSIYIEFSVPVGPPPDFSGGMFCKIDDVSLDSLQYSVSKGRDNYFSVSPDPISSHANLNYYLDVISPIHTSIFDLTGREAMKLPSILSANGSIPFDVDDLPNGLYYLRFEAGGKVEIRKIIVQH